MTQRPEPARPTDEGIDLVAVYRTLLRMVAWLDESEYTDDIEERRQAEVRQHSDLPNPASDTDTSRG